MQRAEDGTAGRARLDKTTAPRSAGSLEGMSTPADETDLPVRRVDTILSFTALGLFILSILLFFSIMAGTMAKVDFKAEPWPAIGTAVYIAPIVAFILVMIVIFSNFRRKARANKAR